MYFGSNAWNNINKGLKKNLTEDLCTKATTIYKGGPSKQKLVTTKKKDEQKLINYLGMPLFF